MSNEQIEQALTKAINDVIFAAGGPGSDGAQYAYEQVAHLAGYMLAYTQIEDPEHHCAKGFKAQFDAGGAQARAELGVVKLEDEHEISTGALRP